MKRSPRSRLLAGSIALLALTGFVAACGDDDDAATSTTVVSTTDETSTATDETAEESAEDTATDDTADSTDESDASTPADGSASGDEADYVAALRQNVALDDEEMSTCLAQAVVDAVGFDRIESSGLSPDEFANSGGDLGEGEQALTPDQRDDLKAAFTDCGDIVGALTSAENMTDDQKDCVRDAISNDMAAEIVANQWTNAENSQEVVDAQDEASTCVDDSEGAATTTTTG